MQKTSRIFVIFFLIGTALQAAAFAQDPPAKKQEKDPKAQDGKSKPPVKPTQDKDKPKTTQQDQVPVTNPSTAAQRALDAYLNSPRRIQLARQPRMFGDWFRPGIQVLAESETPGPTTGLTTQIRIPSAVRVGKISENNSALPVDRAFLSFNYFKNAVNASSIGPDSQISNRTPSLAHWTVGLERTLFDGMISIEARTVIGDGPDFGHNPVGPGDSGVQASYPTMGNSTFVGKILLFENSSTALAAGMGIEVPTGGDSVLQSGSSRIEIENQAVYLSPYIGLLKAPTDSPWFMNLFMQLEAPLNGNGVTGTDLSTGTPQFMGRVNSQTQLYIDTGIGRWIIQQPGAVLSGVAGFFEVHCNLRLNDEDEFSDTIVGASESHDYTFNNLANREAIVDLTTGLHIEIAGQTKLRLGAIFPVSEQRSFDAEFGFQLTQGLR